ncbi:MAG: glycoside hydrolase [Elusimicrobia bacterium]|nr:glycoside hydrolase [Candidatus Liberimonas magnetica]
MKKIYLAFLWHNHQPIYKNPSTGIYELPWVRLHACKDYFDTAAILDEFPKIRANFNLVPSLMIQLDEYAKGIARDKYMDMTLKKAAELSLDEKVFILHNFFMANWETMIFPYPRYKNLLEKRGKHISIDDLKRIQSYFRIQDMLDLQVWFNLSWMDPYWRENDELVSSLYKKGENFTEEDKKALIDKQLSICGLIINKYKELQDKGQIEVSVTPFYHPILPLLLDTNNARISNSNTALPKNRFQHRKDAQVQIQKAVNYYKEKFGNPPKGMWPSEGSVSEDLIPLLTEAEIKWIATDEEILFHSLTENGGRNKLFRPYKIDIFNSDLNIVFRDHALSDAIGFIYSKWDPKFAVKDFINKVHSIRMSLENSVENNLISVILDGENCWEYYSNDGWDFLRCLYQTISDDPLIETVTISQYIQENPPTEKLKRLWPGSWINANYDIWIGHPEDNTAWDYLNETRLFLTDYVLNNPEKENSKEVLSAWENIYIAEGSDWNWWYGDDHSSGNDEIFDYLFRQYLINVYELLKLKAPDYLFKSIKGIARKTPTLEPIDLISPTIDGKVTNYFEWHSAGYYQVGHSGGSMHQVETLLKELYYGFDLKNIYLRLDFHAPILAVIENLSFKIIFFIPEKTETVLSFTADGNIKEFYITTPLGKEDLSTAKAKKIIELAVPIENLKLSQDNNTIEFNVVILKNGSEIERWPYQSSIIMPKPSENISLKTWAT